MKGLLLKDWYMMKKYCKSYLLIAVAFFAVSFVSNDNLFFVFYPCILCGMIPITLLGYDERSRWLQYSGTLPYTKSQIVSAKYLIGLLSQTAILMITGISQAIKMHINDSFRLHDLIWIILSMFLVSVLSSSICLPFIFKLGVERGRFAYYVMIGAVCAGTVIVPNVINSHFQTELRPSILSTLFVVVGVGVYILSWYMSIVFYQKREI